MSGVHSNCIFCEYLFTLVKAKDNQSVLKNCLVKNIFQPEFFIIIYINDHGIAWKGLFFIFIKVARVINIKLDFTD